MLRVAQSLRLGAACHARCPSSFGLTSAEKHQSSAQQQPGRALHADAQPAEQLSPPITTPKLRKSFKLHIGANLPLPTRAGIVEAQPNSAAVPAQTLMAEAVTDYFEGLPLKRWAERLGERVMPTVELVKQEQKRAKAAAAELRSRAGEVAVPVVPSFLPFSRWAASSKRMQGTLVAEDSRQKARLSWYHPDDTMVPRDWFKGGLLADLKYYRPFGGAAAS